MKYSRTAITQLNKWYKSVLVKCAIFNAALLVGFALPAQAEEIIMTNEDYTNSGTITEDLTVRYVSYSNYGLFTNNGTINNENTYTSVLFKNASKGKITSSDSIYFDSKESLNEGSITTNGEFGTYIFTNNGTVKAGVHNVGNSSVNLNKMTVSDMVYIHGGSFFNGMTHENVCRGNDCEYTFFANPKASLNGDASIEYGWFYNGAIVNGNLHSEHGEIINGVASANGDISTDIASTINGDVYLYYSSSYLYNGGTVNGNIYVGPYAHLFNGAEGYEPQPRSVGPFENFYAYDTGVINGNVESFGTILNAQTINGNIALNNGMNGSTGSLYLYNGLINGNVTGTRLVEYTNPHYVEPDIRSLPAIRNVEEEEEEDYSSVYALDDTENTVTGKISTGYIDIFSNATLKVGDGVKAYHLYNDGRLDIGTKAANVKYNAYFSSTSTLALTAKSDTEYGKLTAGTFEIEDGAKLELTLLPGFSSIGEEYTLQLLEQTGEQEPTRSDPEGFNAFTDDFSKIDNTMFEIVRDGDYGLYRVTQLRSGGEMVTPRYQEAAAAWLDGGAQQSETSEQVSAELARIAQQGGDIEAAIEAVAPAATPVVQIITTDNTTRVFNNVLRHLNDASSIGLASGDMLQNVSSWGKAYYNKAEMENRGDVIGFNSHSKGISFGADKEIKPGLKLGLGLQYDNTDIKGKTGYRKIDVDTIAAFVYSEYRPSDWFVNGVATYGYSKYKEKKRLPALTIKSDYHANFIALQGVAGYDLLTDFAKVIPSVGLRYNHLERGKYTDTADQKVSKDKQDLLTTLIGVKLTKDYGFVRPSVYVNALYDVVSDKDNAHVRLTNGSVYDVEGKRMNRFGIEAGLAAEVDYRNWNFIAEYDYEGRRHFDSHTGIFKAKYNF